MKAAIFLFLQSFPITAIEATVSYKMYINSFLALHCVFLSQILTFPLEPRNSVAKSSVFQSVQKGGQAGPAVLEALYRKYNRTVSSNIQPPKDVAAAASNDGTVTSTPVLYDVEYLSPVTIGGQAVNLVFDTGSSDLCVLSSSIGLPLSMLSFWQLGLFISDRRRRE